MPLYEILTVRKPADSEEINQEITPIPGLQRILQLKELKKEKGYILKSGLNAMGCPITLIVEGAISTHNINEIEAIAEQSLQSLNFVSESLEAGSDLEQIFPIVFVPTIKFMIMESDENDRKGWADFLLGFDRFLPFPQPVEQTENQWEAECKRLLSKIVKCDDENKRKESAKQLIGILAENNPNIKKEITIIELNGRIKKQQRTNIKDILCEINITLNKGLEGKGISSFIAAIYPVCHNFISSVPELFYIRNGDLQLNEATEKSAVKLIPLSNDITNSVYDGKDTVIILNFDYDKYTCTKKCDLIFHHAYYRLMELAKAQKLSEIKNKLHLLLSEIECIYAKEVSRQFLHFKEDQESKIKQIKLAYKGKPECAETCRALIKAIREKPFVSELNSQLIQILNETYQLLTSGTTPENYIALAQKVNERDWGKIISGTMLALTGLVLATISGLAIAGSCGLSIPISSLGIGLGFSIAGAGIGTLLVGSGAILAYSGRESGITKAMKALNKAQAADHDQITNNTRMTPKLS